MPKKSPIIDTLMSILHNGEDFCWKGEGNVWYPSNIIKLQKGGITTRIILEYYDDTYKISHTLKPNSSYYDNTEEFYLNDYNQAKKFVLAMYNKHGIPDNSYGNQVQV